MNLSLIDLCHHKWALPILAELHRLGGGCKFVTLVYRLAISKDALSRTLQALLELGLLERNLVHAHPLRPEYLLSTNAKPVAEAALRLLEALPTTAPIDSVIHKKWTLPTLEALRLETQFSKLLKQLVPITNKALVLTLADLEHCGWLERETMLLTPTGLVLSERAAELHARLRS